MFFLTYCANRTRNHRKTEGSVCGIDVLVGVPKRLRGHATASRSVRYYLDPVDRYYSVEDIARIAGIEDIEGAMNFAFLNHNPSIFVLKSIYEDGHPVDVLETVNLEGALAMAVFDMDDNPVEASDRLADLTNFLKPLERDTLR